MDSDNTVKLFIGTVIKPHGMDGYFVVKPLPRDLNKVSNLNKVWLGEDPNHTNCWDIEDYQISNGYLYLKLDKINTRKEASYLKDLRIYLQYNQLESPSLYFVTGFNVYGNNGMSFLGKISEILVDSSQPKFKLKNEIDDSEFFLPAVDQLIEEIRWTKKVVIYKNSGFVK